MSEPNVRFCGSCGCGSVQVNSQQSAPNWGFSGYGSPYTQQPPYTQQLPYVQQPGESKGKGKAIAALIISIVAMILFIPILDVIAGAVAIYLAVTAKKEGVRGGLQTAAFVLSIISTLISVIFTIVCVSAAAGFRYLFGGF